MKTLVVGAGIIGSIYGWAYTGAGHEVFHLVRPGKAEKFKDGFKVDMYDVRKGHKKDYIGHYPIRVTEIVKPEDGYELVIVPSKHYHLLDILNQIVPQAGNADYLLLTQNWDGTEEVDAIIPQSRYVYGDAKAGGMFEKDGTLIATIASVDIGQVNGRHDPCLDKVVALCKSAQVGVTVQPNILHYLWVQYAITGGLWPALIKAGSLEAVFANRQIGEQGVRAARECLEVITRRGVDLKKYPETKMYMNSSPIGLWIAGQVIKFMFRFNKLVQRSSLHGTGDIEEVKAFYYDLLNTGRKLGVDMPAMSAFEADIQKFGEKS
jgi:2-dehydropantoate 2-reductase